MDAASSCFRGTPEGQAHSYHSPAEASGKLSTFLTFAQPSRAELRSRPGPLPERSACSPQRWSATSPAPAAALVAAVEGSAAAAAVATEAAAAAAAAEAVVGATEGSAAAVAAAAAATGSVVAAVGATRAAAVAAAR